MSDADPYQPNPGDTLLFENDRVRVWSMTVEPGGFGRFHSHQHDHLLLWPSRGRSRGHQLGEDASNRIQDAEAGFVAYKAVGQGGGLHPHRLENLEDHPTVHYIIELLDPSPSAHEEDYVTNDRGAMYDGEDADGSSRRA